MMLLAPVAALLIQMAISRTREYAPMPFRPSNRNPQELISALGKLEGWSKRVP